GPPAGGSAGGRSRGRGTRPAPASRGPRPTRGARRRRDGGRGASAATGRPRPAPRRRPRRAAPRTASRFHPEAALHARHCRERHRGRQAGSMPAPRERLCGRPRKAIDPADSMSAPASDAPSVDGSSPHTARHGTGVVVLGLAALGVVYGDIGTSPLYAIKECFRPDYGLVPDHENVLGILSLVFWSLIMVIVVKYLTFIMRADNRGEGGTFALLALLRAAELPRSRLVALGLFGAALLYSDGVITPAISVLSAVEGLELAAPALTPYVSTITIAILAGVFLVQRRGTAGLGAVFGPVTLVWFATIALLGVPWILRAP